MKVSEALETRRSVRGFLDRAVDPAALRRVLEHAARAPSGGNVQPWNVVVLAGEPLAGLKAAMREVLAAGKSEVSEYAVYPERLPEPYRSRRFGVGEALYGHIGIERSDAAGRVRWFAANYQFFGAPIGLFVHTPRFMGPPQWADMGIWLQSVMLMLREEGLDSCPQECWVAYPDTVRRFVPVPDGSILYTGMSIGYRDPDEPANRLVADRAPVDETVTFLGL